MAHRGPDEEGIWVDGPLAIGMRRLRVIDPTGGHQPMPNEDGSVQVVFNGEIYNHRELQAELESHGHRFRTRSDTEAIVHAYEQWGAEFVTRLHGMFAFAVWDARRQELLLARDRLGIKPLYIYDGPEGVVFGSELKAVVAAPWVPVEWDVEAVDDFMTYEFVPAPRSILRGIGKLPPARIRRYRRDPDSGLREQRYWHLGTGPSPESPEEAKAELRRRLTVSVKRRLIADVPLGAFLSGGVDSSILVALMSAEAGEQVRTFSMGFSEASYNELPFARLVADRYGTAHREEQVQPEIVDLAGRLAGCFDEPMADVSAFPTLLISRLAREEVTVALSGDGGDELFAGYDHYRADRWAGRLRWLTRSAAWGPVDRLLDRLPPTAQKKGLVNKAKRFSEGLRRPEDLEHARWWVFWDLIERRAAYAPDFARQLEGRDPFGYYRDRLSEGAQQGFRGLQRQLYADVTAYLPDDILVKLDRMSMAVSLEARVPYLDHEVVEYAFRIPDQWKLGAGGSKSILKEAFADLLPPAIRRRRKEGFSIPLKNWLRGPLKPMMLDLLAPGRIRERGWFQDSEVTRLLDEHVRGRANHAHRLWCLMMLEMSIDGIARRSRERSATLQEVAR
jgi:asparagine synthase (glutamine-hydrolysing)